MVKGVIFKELESYRSIKKIVYYLENKSKSRKMLKISKNNLNRFDYVSNLNKYYKLAKAKI